MAHKTEGDCPVATAVFIRRQADKQGLSVREMIKEYSNESGLPKGTLQRWVWPRKTAVKNDSTDKPMKRHTKPEVRFQISSIAEEILAGNVSDDDTKVVGDAIGTAIEKRVASPRVASKASTAFNKAGKKKGGVPTKKKGLVEIMVDLSHKFVNTLDRVKGQGTNSLNKDEWRMMNKEFKFIIPRMLRILTEMGLDLQGILENYVIPLKEVTDEPDTQKQEVKGLLDT